MLTSEQQHYLFQLNALFSRLESLFTLQQLEHFHQSIFNLRPRKELTEDEQHLRSLEREKRFRAERLKQGF